MRALDTKRTRKSYILILFVGVIILRLLGKRPSLQVNFVSTFHSDPWLWNRITHECKKSVKLGRMVYTPPTKGDGVYEICLDSFVNRTLPEGCVFLTFGIYKDMGFELDAAHKFGCKVYTYDPSDAAAHHVDYIKNSRLYNVKIQYEKIGLWGRDGSLEFGYVNPNSNNPVWNKQLRMGMIGPTEQKKKVTSNMISESKFVLPVQRLESIMKKHGIGYVNVLKIDAEGAEWSFFEDWFVNHPSKRIPCDILMLEFHHFESSMDSRYGGSTVIHDIIQRLHGYGFKTYMIDSYRMISGEFYREYAFIYDE